MDKMQFEAGVYDFPCGVFFADHSGKIIFANDFISELLGCAEKELYEKKSWQELLTVGGKIYYETHFLPLLRMQGYAKEINFDFVSKAGKRIPVVIYAKYESEKRDVLRVVVGEMYQRKLYEKELILERKRAEELVLQLRKKNKELDRFAYVVSHDLKSPLNNIAGLTDLLKDCFSNDAEEALELIADIENSVTHLKKFISEILEYYKGGHIENDKVEVFEFAELMREINLLLNPIKEFEVVFSLEKTTLKLKKIVLKQILLNLMTNSIKYNDKHKVHIEITVSENESSYVFTVHDNGRGIADNDRDKIFGIFGTLGIKDRLGNDGTGIGLATVKRLVESCEGEITFDSKLGVGTAFTFSLRKEK